MHVMLIGVQSITSKNQKNFTVAHIVYPRIGVLGKYSESIFLPAEQFPPASLYLDSLYDVDRDGRGFVLSFELLVRGQASSSSVVPGAASGAASGAVVDAAALNKSVK